MKTVFRILTLSTLLCGMAFFAHARLAFADNPSQGPYGNSTIAPQTCDSNVWTAMSSRSRLETEREVMLNQTLIFKPDSILTYVCFDKFAGHAAEYVGKLFTHTTYFLGMEVISSTGANSMDNAMKTVVADSLTPYITSNYNHAYLGGRGQSLGTGQPSVSYSKGTYACGEMSKVWSAAKCMNFMHNAEFTKSDGFYPFKDLQAFNGSKVAIGYQTVKETRNYPTACNSGQFGDGMKWETLTDYSRNYDGGAYNAIYKYEEPNTKVFTDVRAKVDPGKCSAAIKTGIKVIRGPGESTAGEDGVCTNPGCTYTSGNCQ